MDTEQWVGELSKDSVRDARQRFQTLTAPQAESVKGDWQARYVGPAWLRAGMPVHLALNGFGGWWGKRIGPLGELGGSINLFGPDGSQTRFPMILEEVTSRLDGRPALRLSYPPDARWPWPHATDELRSLDENHLLGMGVNDVPLMRGKAFPFMLARIR